MQVWHLILVLSAHDRVEWQVGVPHPIPMATFQKFVLYFHSFNAFPYLYRYVSDIFHYTFTVVKYVTTHIKQFCFKQKPYFKLTTSEDGKQPYLPASTALYLYGMDFFLYKSNIVENILCYFLCHYIVKIFFVSLSKIFSAGCLVSFRSANDTNSYGKAQKWFCKKFGVCNLYCCYICSVYSFSVKKQLKNFHRKIFKQRNCLKKFQSN